MNSLELNWIRKVDKSIPLPEIVFAPVPDCGGYFIRPTRDEILLKDNLYHPMDRGIIVVSTLELDENFKSVIAHEWRHLWQYWHGWKYDGVSWSEPDNYEKAIIEYFTRSISEADALKFEVKYSIAPYHDTWLALLTNAEPWY